MTTPTHSADIVIIGGGAAGVMTAIHGLRLADTPLRIVLLEPATMLAEGVAYATPAPEHRLNVPVRRMSAFVDRPDDFLEFMQQHHHPGDLRAAGRGDEYAQRRHYAQYLRDRLRHAQAASTGRLDVVHDRAIAMVRLGDDWQVALASGAAVHARSVVLAIGNSLRPLPAHGAAGLPPARCLEAWQYDAIAHLPADADIAIIGTGLSMVDVLLSLQANGHRGGIHLLSRHALIPLPHADTHTPATFDPADLFPLSLRQRVRLLRRHAAAARARGDAWQGVIDRIRPHVQALWQTLSVDDQRRFLRHVVRQWDVHRHRVAPDVHVTVSTLLANGQLRLHRGRLQQVTPVGDRVRLEATLANGATLGLDVDHVINATGVETLVASMRSALLQDLLSTGVAVPGPHGIGIDTAADGEVIGADGALQPGVFTLGSPRIGRLWESLAVPELRAQAETVARRLIDRIRPSAQ
ncbi:MAG: FAD/NAD(P)-binding protein [Lysobacter sp.]